jgi:hypothetical protein
MVRVRSIFILLLSTLSNYASAFSRAGALVVPAVYPVDVAGGTDGFGGAGGRLGGSGGFGGFGGFGGNPGGLPGCFSTGSFFFFVFFFFSDFAIRHRSPLSKVFF